MNQSDEKTIYELKKAKFEMEKEIANSILKFEKEYKVRVNMVDLDQSVAFSDYGRLVLSMIRVEAEVKL